MKRRAIGVVNIATIFAEAHALDVFELPPLGEFFEGVVDFFSDDEIDCLRRIQRLVGLRSDWRPDECKLETGVSGLHHLGQPQIVLPSRCAGVQRHEIIVFRHLDSLFWCDAVRPCVKQAAVLDQACRIR